MSKNTLFDKVWEKHAVGELPDGRTQLFVGMHLMHEVTSPAAFDTLRERGLKVRRPDLTAAVVDHVIPTCDTSRPFKDKKAEIMASTLEDNVKSAGIKYFSSGSGRGGVCHVVFPENGLLPPGITAVCGDSHTCTYGAFGALAFGIGTTQVADVLATQTLAMEKLKVRRINYEGRLALGVTPKDLIIHTIHKLGVDGGTGFAYEFGGEAIDLMDMAGRMTVCNMAVEGGARSGYVNPDETTFEFLESILPKEKFSKLAGYWRSIASEKDAEYDDIIEFDASEIQPMVTWGINPEQAAPVTGSVPLPGSFEGVKLENANAAYGYMGLEPGKSIYGTPVDVVFIGSCTNGRLEDLAAAASILEGRKVAVRTLVVPGSESVKRDAEWCGYDQIFEDAGAEWRQPGCSMCLAMNPDKLVGAQRSASTSNRNFKGRQGSPTGRTHLMSPYTAAATAIEGAIADPRKYMEGGRK